MNNYIKLSIYLAFISFITVGFSACSNPKNTTNSTANPEKELADINPIDANGVFGRYLGVLRHESLKQDQLAKLDFVLSREAGNKLELMAILTLHFGDYASKEYVAYHFDNVQYNLITQTLIFDDPNMDITIRVTGFAKGKFEGELRSNFSGNVGQLLLSQETAAKAVQPLMEPISGEYEGKCMSYPSRLQLRTYRSMEDTARVGNPFASYRVRGELGQDKGETQCGLFSSSSDGYCIWAHFEDASYNYFKGQLVLTGPRQSLVCKVTPGGGLSCGEGCDLKRRSDEMMGTLKMMPPTSESALSITTPGNPALGVPVESIQGEYTGYLHHEYLNTYQPAKINILTYQGVVPGSEESKLQLSAVATLFFGELNSAEALPYRFTTRVFPNPIVDRQFVFKRSENDVDAVLQVTEFGKGVVKGVWNSILFGRVGTFELRKDGNVNLPDSARKMGPVSGEYEGNLWDLNLVVSLGKTPANTENPFFPLSISGWAYFREAGFKTTIKMGSYDFYTGKLGFENGEKSAFIGSREETRGTLKLGKYGRAITSPLGNFTPEPFRRTPIRN